MAIVSTNVSYSSSILEDNLQDLLKIYSFLTSDIIGYSVLGKPLYAITIGNGAKKVFYSASYHANEWITTPVLMKFIEDVANAYVSNTNLLGYSIRDLLSKVTIHLCPMVNPDGVDLVTGALPKNSPAYRNVEKIAYSFATIPFPDGWKANINGVDLKIYQPICKVL